MTPELTHKPRLISIDVLKTLAVLLILNHRMQLSYGDYTLLATGGALGCGLFFFLSGYASAFAQTDSFKNWINKRIGRLVLPVLIAAFFCDYGVHRVFCTSFMWFVHCLVIYFMAFYFIKKYAMKYISLISAFTLLGYMVYYILIGNSCTDLYGRSADKYVIFFAFYLSGAAFRIKDFSLSRRCCYAACILAPILLMAEMLIRMGAKSHDFLHIALVLSPLLLLTGILVLSMAATPLNALPAESFFRRKIAPVFATIGALSLESYIGIGIISNPLQKSLVHLFPFNLPLVVIVLLLFCYFLRVCSRLALVLINDQTENFNLRYLLKPY